MFFIMKQRKGPNGRKQWMAVVGEEFSGEERVPLETKAQDETRIDPNFEYAVFERLVSDAPDLP